MVAERPDLKQYLGRKLTVIAWIWARTVKSPNPAFAHVDVPLASTFMLSTKKGKEAYVEPVIEGGEYRFTVKVGKPRDLDTAKRGTKSGSSGSSFLCLLSGTPMTFEYLRSEAKAGRMSSRLMSIVAEGDRGRVYLSPIPKHESIADESKPNWKPDTDLPTKALGFRIQEYGMTKWCDLFTPRQLMALTTFSDLVGEAMERVRQDGIKAGLPDDDKPLRDAGVGARAYAEAVGVYLACGISRSADFWSSLCIWANQPKNELVTHLFGRQAIPMAWDFAEANPFSGSGGNFIKNLSYVSMGIDYLAGSALGYALQVDAATNGWSAGKLISMDPPYYDNIGYADLSDYFYVWLRRSLKLILPDIFATLTVPKAEELVATPYRHNSKAEAEAFFLGGMTQAMHRLAEQAHSAFPVTIYYAFKQTESDGEGTASTGWDTFLAAVIEAGFVISGTWPIRTERQGRMIGNDTNALASSIVLVCRKRDPSAPTTTRRDFINALKAELPEALRLMQRGNIAPVDLAQASIGPGMGVFTRYAKVLDAQGNPMTVREALALINQILDETLAEQEGDFDHDTRWAVAWFEQHWFSEGEFGVADVLARAKNTSVSGLVEAGILVSKAGKVRLFKPEELPPDWDPDKDKRLTVWEMVHHLIRLLETEGEQGSARIAAKLGARGEPARELAYRLYTLCERKKRASEALSYNALVQSWPEIMSLAQEVRTVRQERGSLL